MISFRSLIKPLFAVALSLGGLLYAYEVSAQESKDVKTRINYSQEKSGFVVKARDVVTPYRETAVFVLPGESIIVEPLFEANDAFQLTARSGKLTSQGKHRWQWQAPNKKGLYKARLKNTTTQETAVLNLFVMVPFERIKNGRLNNYRIGQYPESDNPAYQKPRGFVEVTRENQNTKISPHFTLKQFLCKQSSGWPKYVALDNRLGIKLEMILEEVNQQGFDANTFAVLSGYRTPFYNRSIGNVKFSRHVYGDAADIYIDINKDGRMDDINNDGTSDYDDALTMARWVEDMTEQSWYEPFIGGLGIYGARPHRGPFIHIDVRGNKARWVKP